MVNLTLEQILQSKPLSVMFISYLKKIHATEELEFWLEIEVFRRLTECMECMKEAKRIYARFLSDTSFSEINIAGGLRDEVRDTMENNVWDQRLFDNAQKSVYEALNFTCVRTFCAETSKYSAAVQGRRDSGVVKYGRLIFNKIELSMSMRKRDSANLASMTLYILLEKYQDFTAKEQKESEKQKRLIPRIASRLGVKKSSTLRGAKKDKHNPTILPDLSNSSSGSNSESEEPEKKKKHITEPVSEGEEDSPRSLGRPKSLRNIFLHPIESSSPKQYDAPVNLRKSASAPFYVQYEGPR